MLCQLLDNIAMSQEQDSHAARNGAKDGDFMKATQHVNVDGDQKHIDQTIMVLDNEKELFSYTYCRINPLIIVPEKCKV